MAENEGEAYKRFKQQTFTIQKPEGNYQVISEETARKILDEVIADYPGPFKAFIVHQPVVKSPADILKRHEDYEAKWLSWFKKHFCSKTDIPSSAGEPPQS